MCLCVYLVQRQWISNIVHVAISYATITDWCVCVCVPHVRTWLVSCVNTHTSNSTVNTAVKLPQRWAAAVCCEWMAYCIVIHCTNNYVRCCSVLSMWYFPWFKIAFHDSPPHLQAERHYYEGRHDKARSSSRKALVWSIVSIVVGILLIIALIVLQMFARSFFAQYKNHHYHG